MDVVWSAVEMSFAVFKLESASLTTRRWLSILTLDFSFSGGFFFDLKIHSIANHHMMSDAANTDVAASDGRLKISSMQSPCGVKGYGRMIPLRSLLAVRRTAL